MRPAIRWALLVVEAARGLLPMLFIELASRRAALPGTCRRLGLRLDLDSGAPPATRPVTLTGRDRRTVRGCLLLARHWPAGDSCLRRSLLVGYRLRRLRPVLRVGVRRGSDGSFGAHSWLELDGATFDPAAAAFAALGPGPA